MPSQILARVIRGETVESIHRGHLIVVDGDGNTVASVGDPRTVTFMRSAAKPFQALPFVTSGAADEFGYSEEEIAMACASHSGEAVHVRITKLMLDRCGMTEAHLRCGTHMPFSEKESERMLRAGESPTQLHNNCSGKHAAMLAFAKHIDADPASYDAIDNPVQRAILEAVSKFTEVPENDIKLAIDGCAAPNFALPMAAMAKSFINLISPAKFDEPTQSACRRDDKIPRAHRRQRTARHDANANGRRPNSLESGGRRRMAVRRPAVRKMAHRPRNRAEGRGRRRQTRTPGRRGRDIAAARDNNEGRSLGNIADAD